jgi:fused signal recognition particle receptor
MPFGRFKQALGKLSRLFAQVKEAPVEAYEEVLLQADVGVKYTALILEKVRRRADPLPALKQEIFNLINRSFPKIETPPPLIVMVCGVNGTGKTTTVAKLAHIYNRQGGVLLASCDTYRDAASEQLAIWSKRAGVEIVLSQKGQDAAAVAFDAVNKALTKKIPTVLVDTAGRLHTRTDLMAELKKIRRVITKLKPSGPDLVLLTIDSTLGQNSLQQALSFTREVGVNGLILTKFDGTAKGGCIIPISQELGLPVLYLGLGEGIEDLAPFDPQEFVEVLFEGSK